VGVALSYGSSSKFGVPLNISVMAEASDFKFGQELGFAMSNYKMAPKDKSGRGLRLGSSYKFGGSSLIFLQWLNLLFLIKDIK